MVALSPQAQELMDRFINKGIEQGIEQSKKFIVSNILSNGLSYDETSRLTGLSVGEINEIANSK